MVDEFNRLQDAAETLAKLIGSAASEATSAAAATVTHRRRRGHPPGRKKVGRPPGRPKVAASTAAPAAAGRRRRAGRRKDGGQRATQALSLVKGHPGITIPELAAKMGIKGTYLYKVLPPLEQEGKIRKEGRGWYPTAS